MDKTEFSKIDLSKQWLRVVSDSMFDPAIPHDSCAIGDLVKVDPALEAEDGDFVMVESGEFVTLMKLFIEDGRRLVKYLNPAWPDVIEMGGETRIAGVVTMKGGRRSVDVDEPETEEARHD
jgi:SOS-response transcriptional repressor LexA